MRRGVRRRPAFGLALLLAACGAPRPGRAPEEYLRVGVDPASEADAVARALEAAGFEETQRVSGSGFVALAFARGSDGRRAVRVVTRIGVAVALDSHESDGVRVRHGHVRLVEHGAAEHDLDRDGRPEVVVARAEDGGGECLAIIRLFPDGRARAARVEAENVAPGSCASALDDVDGDGRVEVIVEVGWPALALSASSVPALRVALGAEEGGWRAGATPAAFVERERAERRRALADARARLDVAAASRLGVELAALANVAGATPDAQVRWYDEALAGLVLREDERDRVRAVRAYIAAGWAERARSEGARPRAAVAAP